MATGSDVAVQASYLGLRSRLSARLRSYALFPFLGLLALVVVYPIFMVVYGSFKGDAPGADAPFSVDGYVRAWTNWETYQVLALTVWLTIPRVIGGVIFAVFLTWMMTRTNTPWRGVFEQFMWLRVFLPVLPLVVAWMLIAGGRTGIVNRFLMDTFSLSAPPLDMRSYWGVIFMTVMFMGSFFFIYVGPAFRNMDASLEESSLVSGAGQITTLWRITIPIMMPAILGITMLMFVSILSSFELELFFLSTTKGVFVFTTYIWRAMGKAPSDFPYAMALSSVFLLFISIIIVLQFRILGSRQYVTLTGRGFNVRVIDLGKWKWVTFSVLAAWTLVGVILPLAVLVLGTFVNTYGVLSSGFTLRHWKDALDTPTIIRSIKNTALLAVMVATAGTLLYALMSYIYLRTRLKGRQMIEVLSWVPRGAPSIVLAVGILWAILGGGIPGIKLLWGSLFLMAFVLVIEGLPGGMRIMNGSMVQLSSELEEASRVSGGSWLRTMRRVVVPLITPALVNAWLMQFLWSTRALVVLLFIYLPASKVLAIEIFESMITSEPQKAVVLGVILTAICIAAAALARFVAARQRRVLEVAG